MSEIVSSLYESVLFVVFLTIFLELKKDRKIFYLGMPICAGFLFGNIIISDYFVSFSVYTILIDFTIMILYWKICLKGTFLRFFMGFALYYLGLYFSSHITFLCSSLLGVGLSAAMEAGDNTIRILCIVFAKSLLLVYTILVLRNRNKFLYYKSGIVIFSYFVLPVISLFIFTMLTESLNELYSKEPQLGIRILITSIGLFFMVALNVYLSIHAARKQEKEREVEKLNQMMEIQKASIERFIQQENEAHKVKHDLRHKLYSIEYLLEQNKVVESAEIFKKIIEDIYGNSKNMTVEQNIIDTVISNIELKFASSGVCIQKDISYFADDIMDLTDLCILIGNLADNAIEAASMSAEKKVMITVKEEKKCLYINFSNTFSEEHSDIHRFSTKKEDAWKHGFGMHSIREIVDRYHGDFRICVENDSLQFIVIIFGLF